MPAPTRARAAALAALVLTLPAARAARADGAAPPTIDAAAAERGCADGSILDCTRLGLALSQGTHGVSADPARARRLLERACELGQGHVPACTALALLLRDGHGPEHSSDEQRALGILERACRQDEPSACASLGLIFTEGLGVPYKPPVQRMGATFYRKGCDLGHARACWHYGLLLQSGFAVTKDPAAARAYFTKGCKAGYQIACDELKPPTERP